ncbi:hypothetical protein niasHT_012306 [Heterodera trifolii]|uniref:Uncharacterized protein n=1 Tax=Heterodera trifolii TaxID=157864 RepID=A0ABD2LDT8_9BILA
MGQLNDGDEGGRQAHHHQQQHIKVAEGICPQGEKPKKKRTTAASPQLPFAMPSPPPPGDGTSPSPRPTPIFHIPPSPPDPRNASPSPCPVGKCVDEETPGGPIWRHGASFENGKVESG